MTHTNITHFFSILIIATLTTFIQLNKHWKNLNTFNSISNDEENDAIIFILNRNPDALIILYCDWFLIQN